MGRCLAACEKTKNLAFRLHSKRCDAARMCKLSNQTFGHRAPLESETAFIDKRIAELKRK